MKSKVAQRTFSLALGAACATAGAVPFVGGAAAQEVLPIPPAPFKGQIGLSAKDSKSDFPQPVQAPKGAPNVVLVMLDDVGFGASSTFGGPCRHADARPAGQERAALHAVPHHGALLAHAGGAARPAATTTRSTPASSWSRPPASPATTASWARTPRRSPRSSGRRAGTPPGSARTTTCPTGRPARPGRSTSGRPAWASRTSTGSSAADTNQWRPAAFDGTKPIEPYLGNPDYNFDYDIADQAIEWVRNQKAVAPDKPFFLYYAPGATHSPHHPKKEWIAKYKGQFDQGLGQGPRGDARAAEEAGHRAGEHAADPAQPGHPGVGFAQRRAEAALRLHDGGLRRVPVADRLQRRPRPRGHRASSASSTTRWSSTSAATTAPAPRAASRGPQRDGHPERDRWRTYKEVLEAQGRPGHVEDAQPLSRRLGARHVRPVPVDQADRLPLRRHAQRDGHLLAGPHQGQGRHPAPVAPRHRHRADHPRRAAIAAALHPSTGSRRSPSRA